MQQAENPTPAVVISVDAAGVDNAIHFDYLTSEVALQEPEIRSTDPNTPTDDNCTDDNLHFRLPGGSVDYDNEGDESEVSDAIPTARRRRPPATELESFDLRTSDVDGFEGEDGDDVYADEEEEALQADDGSTQNVED